MNATTKQLVDKWKEVLGEGNKIRSKRILKSTALMLENEYKYLRKPVTGQK